jgi:hypothetical protein
MPARLARASLLLSVLGILIFGDGWSPAIADQPETIDDVYLALESQVPGFGGMYAEGDTLTVFLTDPGQRGAAERAIAVHQPAGVPAGGIQVKQGQYGFSQLKGWQMQANALFELPGVVFTDVDESQNRIAVGVEQKGHTGAVMQALMRMGIPLKAVDIVETGPIAQMATLRERVRPLQGGLQINFPGYLCTYGFNAVRGGMPGFVTNSHCTTDQGGVERTPYYQPTQTADPALIGTEAVDPNYSANACPAGMTGKVCRYSDSAFVSLNTTDIALGKIAKTGKPGSITITGQYTITDAGAATAGTVVNKMGRTSGWSQGRVTNTCANTAVSGSNVVELCQTWVKAKVESGDSGSPVFRITAGDNVELLGILWGGGAGTFVYSPLGQVQQELGPLTVR